MNNTILAQHLFQEDLYLLPSRVIVVLSQPWEAVNENDRLVLTKMLNAVRLNPATVQIIQKSEFDVQDLQPLAPSKVLVFGARIKQSPKLYEFVTINGIPLIVAESLELLDDAKKKTLWGALKQMFAL